MSIPNVKLIAMVITLIGVLIYAGSTTVSGCADYGVALGGGPNYDVRWMDGTIDYLAEYDKYRCTGNNISDRKAWFYVNNYAGRLVNWICASVGVRYTLTAISTSSSWFMIRSGFFGPFLAQYDVYGDYQYLGYCENVVYSYSIRARLVWP